MKTKLTIFTTTALIVAFSGLLCIAQNKLSKREWTLNEKVRIGYTMPRALIRTEDVVGTNADPIAKALLMQGIAVGIAMGRNTTNDIPYSMLLEGVTLWSESRQAYMEAVKTGDAEQ